MTDRYTIPKPATYIDNPSLGDLITVDDNTRIFASAWVPHNDDPPWGSTTGSTTVLVLDIHGSYIKVLLPSGTHGWIHRGSSQLARKADRT